jgi:hypothetical protein
VATENTRPGRKRKRWRRVLVTPLIEIMPLIYGGTGIGVSSIRALKMGSSSEFDLRMDVISLGRSQLLEDFGAITVESSANLPEPSAPQLKD